MLTPDNLNKAIEDETGIPDVLCLHRLYGMPLFGHSFLRGSRDRLAALLAAEEVDLATLDLRRAIDFLMPSTTDFGRSFVGNQVAGLVESSDPKVVTLGCSTGLEVYWVASALKRKGLLSDNGKIMGVDINESALQVARCGEYDRRSFDITFLGRDSWAKESLIVDDQNAKVRFRDDLKSHVGFERGNIIDLESLSSLGLAEMDIVVVMNVLKYMSSIAQQKALGNVAAILRKGGRVVTDVYTNDLFAMHDSFVPGQNEQGVFLCVK